MTSTTAGLQRSTVKRCVCMLSLQVHALMQGQLTAALEGKDWSTSLPSEADGIGGLSPSGLAGPPEVLDIDTDGVLHAVARLKLTCTGPQDGQGGLLCSSQGLECVVPRIPHAGAVVHGIREHGRRGDDVGAAASGSCGVRGLKTILILL